MSRNLQFFWFVITIATAGVVFGFLDTQMGPSEIGELHLNKAMSLPPQPSLERMWRQIRFERAFTIGSEEPPSVNRPSIVKVDAKGNMYVLDVGDRVVKKFDSSGLLLHRFGSGKGTAPGEFEFPSDFLLAHDGGVWVSDASRDSISIFEQSGKLRKVIEVKGGPFRILERPQGGYIVMLVHAADHLFEAYSDKGEKLSSFGEILTDQARNAVALEGWISDNGAERFSYAAYRFGFIGSFSYNGRLNFAAQ